MRIALVVKNKPAAFKRDNRGVGYFSYLVPEFEWDHFTLGDYFRFNTEAWKRIGYDVVIQEDGGNWGEYLGPLPTAMLIIDSTLTEDHHYRPRQVHARQFGLVLVDHDKLERFSCMGKVMRFSYCVNDKIFKPGEKCIDVSFHCASSKVGDGTRSKIRQALSDWAATTDYVYTSGAMGLEEYADAMGKSRIVVNWPRVPINRPHRVFDAMASGACLVTGILPEVSEEDKQAGVHYIEVEKWEDVPATCQQLLETGDWEKYAKAGYELMKAKYTWAIRAKELREIIRQEFGL